MNEEYVEYALSAEFDVFDTLVPYEDEEELESRVYYYGLPSSPISVFHTGDPWQKPTGFEAYIVPKVIRPVFDDDFARVWEEMGARIYKHLDAVNVNWTTIDVVRFAEPEKYNPVKKPVGPIVLWIGVHPKSLSRELAEKAANTCENILQSFDIHGVEIAFRESLFRRYSRTLLDYVSSDNPIANVYGPLTAALGLPIASVQTPGSEGTGGIYLCTAEHTYLLTARHVVLPPEVPNILYDQRQNSQDAVQVMVPSPAAFDGMVESISDKINTFKSMKTKHEKQLNDLLTNRIWNSADKKQVRIESNLEEERTSIKILEDFQSNVLNDWVQESDFIIGRVVYAPPISVNEGPKGNSEDWALIELDDSKIDYCNFRGNVIDLGPETTIDKFLSWMHPLNFKFRYPTYPNDRLFPILSIAPEHELTRPKTKDEDGKPYIPLIKNNGRTKTTVGFGNGIKSFVREQWNGIKQTSLEYAIVARKQSAFSGCGDSGSVIVDRDGRAAALLIGGCGYNESADITYGTPIEWLIERIKVQFPDIHFLPGDADRDDFDQDDFEQDDFEQDDFDEDDLLSRCRSAVFRLA
ncbi:hypothetical protein BDQ17DRAFT_1342765 [Cyathus striatus]|nr:hypothetical protein BDQ17DRAFT_1342765 [Cyathus striatus]